MTKYIAFALAAAIISIAAPSFASDARQRTQMLDYCMRKAELSNHAPSGNVVIGLEISSSGMVTHAALESSTTNIPELSDCSLRMIRRWRFSPQATAWDTSYTVVYSANGLQASLN